jgi:hypothetical protein
MRIAGACAVHHEFGRGKNGKDQRSFAFAEPFGRKMDSAQPCRLSEPKRTDANARTSSTSWGHWFEHPYRPSENPLETEGFLFA